jgi:DNA mismatch repair protein MutL
MKSNNKIKILSEDVTNTIDSNKTITKIAIVVKELLENSIDALSRNITIVIKDGGISSIEIKDDGNGINKADYVKLCQRFNSSKLSDYVEMERLSTFGFRGEALSILSYISSLYITSKIDGEEYGYEANFKNGKMISVMKPVCCDVGTSIKVENIFNNNSLRKNYYDKTDETKDIINLIQKYAFHFHNINFSLSSNIITNLLLKTKTQSITDRLEIARYLSARLYTPEVSDNLFYFDNRRDNLLNITFECLFTKPSANLDKSNLIIFVNNRLVINQNIKKIVEQTYSKFLIKNGNYFVYFDIKCQQDQIDINIKGNKLEVYINNEDRLIMQIKYLLEENLNEEISSKNYYIGSYTDIKKKDNIVFNPKEDITVNVYAKDKVRVDMRNMSIEHFLRKKNENNNQINFNDCVKLIFNELYIDVNERVTDIINNCFFIGYENDNHLAFIQYDTTLYIVNLHTLLNEYFLFMIFSNEASEFFSKMKIRSNFETGNFVKYVKDNIDQKFCKGDIDLINNIFEEKKHLFGYLNIRMENVIQFDEIFFIDVETGKDLKQVKSKFLSYFPLISYSLIEYLKQYINREIKNENENLNFMIDVAKIYSFYLSNLYIDYFSQNTFPIRKNLREDFLLEKIITTETLYTVFERC